MSSSLVSRHYQDGKIIILLLMVVAAQLAGSQFPGN